MVYMYLLIQCREFLESNTELMIFLLFAKCKVAVIESGHLITILINPRRACAARVTVVGLSVCLFVR